MLTPLEFVAIALDPATQSPVLVLREQGGQTSISMTVSHIDANTVAAQSMQMAPERPHTIDFIKALLDRFGAPLHKVVIDTHGESSLTARVYLAAGSHTEVVECRPADAIALALRCSAPLFATADVLNRSQSRNQLTAPERLRVDIAGLDTVDFGKYCLE